MTHEETGVSHPLVHSPNVPSSCWARPKPPSWSPVGVAGVHTLRPSSATFQVQKQGAGSEAEQWELEPALSDTECLVTSCSMIHSATTLAPVCHWFSMPCFLPLPGLSDSPPGTLQSRPPLADLTREAFNKGAFLFTRDNSPAAEWPWHSGHGDPQALPHLAWQPHFCRHMPPLSWTEDASPGSRQGSWCSGTRGQESWALPSSTQHVISGQGPPPLPAL